MKTEIEAKTYQNYYEATDFNASAYEVVLERLGYDVGNLTVNGDLNFRESKIRRLVGVKEVTGYLDLEDTPISKKYSEEEIRQMVNVEGNIFM